MYFQAESSLTFILGIAVSELDGDELPRAVHFLINQKSETLRCLRYAFEANRELGAEILRERCNGIFA